MSWLRPWSSLGSRFWDIPELVTLVADSLPKADRSRLARTSRLCFYALIGSVWCEVQGACHLLALLPEFEIKRQPQPYRSDKIILTLPNPFTSKAPRFHFYASLVRKLEIYETPGDEYLVDEWDAFARGYLANEWDMLTLYAWQTPLLPNLKILSMRTSHVIIDDTQSRWLVTFLSPNLTTMETLSDGVGYPPSMSYPAASKLMDCIAQRCPHLETLAIFPDVEMSPDDMEPAYASSLSHNAALPYEYFGRLNRLSALTIGRDALKPSCLQILGKLSHLTALEIHNEVEAYEAIPQCPLTDDSFPKLKRLLLRELSSSEMLQIWKIEPLVRQITVAELYFSDGGEDGESPAILFSAIAKTSLRIEDIAIYFDGDPSEAILCSLIELSPLSLRRLSLSADGLDLGVPAEWCKILADSFPSLQHLHFSSQPVHFKDLIHFTKLRNLRSLALKIQWPCEQDHFYARKPSNPSLKLGILECGLQPLRFPLSVPFLGELVRHLLKIWPNFQAVQPTSSQALDNTKEYLLLNKAIEDSRQMLQCACSICLRKEANSII